MRQLALDLSTRAGAAWWLSPDLRPKCWTWKLVKTHDPEDYGARTWDLMEKLEGFISLQVAAGAPVEVLSFESPFIPFSMFGPKDGESAFNTTMQTLRLQIALASVIELVAKKHKIERCIEVSTQSAKMNMLGFARKPHPKFDWKKSMLLEATRQGYAVADDHQADAIAVGRVAYEHLGTPVS